MAFIEVIPLEGNEIVPVTLEGIEKRAGDPQPAFELIIESFHTIENRRWTEEGPGWPALADSTMERKADGMDSDEFQFDEMMMRTGDLFFSLAGGEGSTGFGVLRTNDFVQMETDVPWAQFHQTGTQNMPARPVVQVNEATLLLWSKMIQSYVIHGVLAEATEEDIMGAL
jgi:hypothetical protein